MRKGRLLGLIGLLVSVLLTLAGTAAADKTSLVVAVDTPPVSMDPASSFTDANFQVVANFFDGLVEHAGYEGQLVPNLAVKWERTGPLTWKIWLRQGVKFHNGNPFTAEDVVYTFKRMLDPACCSEFLDTGKMVKSLEVLDDYTVVMTSADPNPAFMEYVAFGLILDKESMEKRDLGDITLHPIGTGPYKLVEWVKGSYVKLTANEEYWAGAPPIKNVELQPITESSTRFAALASGQVEMIQNVPVELFDKVKENPNLEIILRPGRRCIHLALGNQPGKPWADLRVRKAIYLAINEDEIIEKLMRGQAIAATQLADPAETGFVSDIQRLPYDPEQAKKLMAEAGFEK
ncbi:MAG: ABC transporter substrate-binding protein, partial [Thermodesulfobacteriota bacterium]